MSPISFTCLFVKLGLVDRKHYKAADWKKWGVFLCNCSLFGQFISLVKYRNDWHKKQAALWLLCCWLRENTTDNWYRRQGSQRVLHTDTTQWLMVDRDANRGTFKHNTETSKHYHNIGTWSNSQKSNIKHRININRHTHRIIGWTKLFTRSFQQGSVPPLHATI